jgi:hypothetical protein
MKIPANVIETGKYTSGGEFVYKSNQSPYKGYYYILNERFFEGKEYKADAQEIIQIKESNTLLYRLATAAFSLASGITSQSLRQRPVPSVQSNIEGVFTPIRYFSRKVNIKPIIIKEISKETYDSLQGDPLYQTTFVGPDQSIDQAEKQMPGLKAFLEG